MRQFAFFCALAIYLPATNAQHEYGVLIALIGPLIAHCRHRVTAGEWLDCTRKRTFAVLRYSFQILLDKPNSRVIITRFVAESGHQS